MKFNKKIVIGLIIVIVIIVAGYMFLSKPSKPTQNVFCMEEGDIVGNISCNFDSDCTYDDMKKACPDPKYMAIPTCGPVFFCEADICKFYCEFGP
ncbi:MAG: hypothetical protein ACE5J7_04600 [Candidatus Aenigmatarchaeota archaeon]